MPTMVGACPLYRRGERAGLSQDPGLNQSANHDPDPVSLTRPGR
jgi:hypothetical protein